MREVSFTFFRHDPLQDMASVIDEQKKLYKFLQDEEEFDLILVDNPFSSLVIPHDLSTRIVFDCIDWYEEMYCKEFGIDARYYLLRYAMKDLLSRAYAVIAQSPVILDALKTWGLKTTRTAVIPNGYDASIFKPYNNTEINKYRAIIEKKHGISLKNKKVITYTGKLGSWYESILDIAEAVPEDYVLLVVGDGTISGRLPAKSNVVKCGVVPLPEVPHYTNIADILVFPVAVDCSPIAISEYLAVRKPIVMERGRMEWLLKDGITGSMVDNNRYSWQRGFEQAYAHRKVIGKHNGELANTLSWDILARQFSAFLGDL